MDDPLIQFSSYMNIETPILDGPEIRSKFYCLPELLRFEVLG